ncbi:MAG: hypothetical protein COA86_08285 [Kangiella sp.]|nr:MAG: hypothetical protein COA86_08285 [Kangiella sp.]
MKSNSNVLKNLWSKNKPMVKRFLSSRKSLLLIAGAGLITMILIIKLQPDMVHNDSQRPSIPVSYIEVKRQLIKPEIIGYGTVKPDVSLEAKAEITGRITYINPLLKKGEIFAKDTLLIQIDDKDYLLQLKQSHADLLANRANLTEMEINIENNELELKLAREKLKVREKEYSRLRKLRKTGAISQSNLDAEKQNLLQQKQEMQQLKNKQTTLPSTLEVMKAQLEIAKAKLVKSERDLERTQVKIPFNGRISQVYTELHQYMPTGSQLFDASGLEKIMINAQFPINQFSSFTRSFDQNKVDFKAIKEIPSMSKVLESLGLTAVVEEAGGGFKGWSAKVERFTDDLDPKSRTVGVIVTVEGSYKNIEPGIRPPLLEGMYMKVFLRGEAVQTIAIPRYAMHEDQIYIINADDQLKRITLANIQYQGELILVKDILKSGDRVITSDVFPAVDGMQLTPIIDKTAIIKMDTLLDVEKLTDTKLGVTK